MVGTEPKDDVQRHVESGEDRLETGHQARDRRPLATLAAWLGGLGRCWGINKMGLGGREVALFWGELCLGGIGDGGS